MTLPKQVRTPKVIELDCDKWCKVCREASQDGDYDFDVSCDMEVEA